MTSNSSTVSQDLAVRLLGDEGHALPLTATLHYDAADPLAVTALFDDGGKKPVRWVFSRALLVTGMDRLTGNGDVVIWPTFDDDGERAIHIQLRSPHGDALLEAPADALETFLSSTSRLVPPGTEHEAIDLDALVHALLSET